MFRDSCALRLTFWSAFLAFLPFLCFTNAARAGDYDEDLFGLRFSASLTRFSPYADVAAVGGASAGSKWFSALNPASAAWNSKVSDWEVSLSPQYSMLCFSEGQKLHVSTQSATVDLGQWGTLIPSFAHAHSNVRETKQGLDFEYDTYQVQVQYGVNVDEETAIGGAFAFSDASIQFDWNRMQVSDSHSESYMFRLGGLHRPADGWLVGAIVEYGFVRGRTIEYDLTGFLPDVKTKDTSHQMLLRPGVSYEYLPDSSLFLDYELATFWDHTGHLVINRFHAGVDHQLVNCVFVRAGTTVDMRGKWTWTTGFGVYPTDWLSIDAAYQCNALPEIEREFGRSQQVTVSVSISW